MTSPTSPKREYFHYEAQIHRFCCKLKDSHGHSYHSHNPSYPNLLYELDSETLQGLSSDQFKHLAIFDFDGTLFKSPHPSRNLWTPALIQWLIDCGSWYTELGTLSPPLVPAVPDISWFDHDTLSAARHLIEHSPSTLTILLTGRQHEIFMNRILTILNGISPKLAFHMIFLKECHTSQNPSILPRHPNTLNFKIAVIQRLLDRFRSIRSLDLWDDRTRHISAFQKEFDLLVKVGRIDSFELHTVRHAEQLNPHIDEFAERDLVQDIVTRYQLKFSIPGSPKLLPTNYIKPVEDMESPLTPSGNVGINITIAKHLPNESSKYPSLVDVTLFTGLKLCLESIEALREHPQIPNPLWNFYGDHVVLSLGHNEAVLDFYADRKDNISLEAVAINIIPGKAVLVRVHGNDIEEWCDEYRDPHILLWLAPTIRVNQIQMTGNWAPLLPPIPLNTTLYEKKLTGLSSEQVKPKRVIPIGKLVVKHRPDLKGPEIGEFIRQIEKRMEVEGIVDRRGNIEIIESIVKSMSKIKET